MGRSRDLPNSRKEYEGMPMETRADMCIDCGECEDKCPQRIAISNWMPIVHEALRAR